MGMCIAERSHAFVIAPAQIALEQKARVQTLIAKNAAIVSAVGSKAAGKPHELVSQVGAEANAKLHKDRLSA